MSEKTKTAGETARKLTALERAQIVGRKRAYYNREKGGVLITAEQTKSDYNGVHWRALVDGGNCWNGKLEWIAGRASGGGYDVRAAALAEAVRGIVGTRGGQDGIGWHNFREWPEIAQRIGWTLHTYGDFAVVLVPGDAVAAKIKAEIEGEWRAE